MTDDFHIEYRRGAWYIEPVLPKKLVIEAATTNGIVFRARKPRPDGEKR